ncbi:MAG: TlpA disulfide reductase family protein [Chitinophagaceae bacterium]
MRLKIYLIALFISLAAVNGFSQEIKSVKITDLEKTIRESKTALIISFWATFCKPCIAEIPYFQQEVKKHQSDSVQLILVSLDLKDYFPAKIKSFATKMKVNAPIVWLDETNADYFCPKIDASWSGAIPSSLFINNKTGYRKFYEEQLSEEKLQSEIVSMLK